MGGGGPRNCTVCTLMKMLTFLDGPLWMYIKVVWARSGWINILCQNKMAWQVHYYLSLLESTLEIFLPVKTKWDAKSYHKSVVKHTHTCNYIYTMVLTWNICLFRQINHIWILNLPPPLDLSLCLVNMFLCSFWVNVRGWTLQFMNFNMCKELHCCNMWSLSDTAEASRCVKPISLWLWNHIFRFWYFEHCNHANNVNNCCQNCHKIVLVYY